MFLTNQRFIIVVFSSVAPHRGQPAAKCHTRWQLTRRLAVSCGLWRRQIQTRNCRTTVWDATIEPPCLQGRHGGSTEAWYLPLGTDWSSWHNPFECSWKVCIEATVEPCNEGQLVQCGQQLVTLFYSSWQEEEVFSVYCYNKGEFDSRLNVSSDKM